MLATAQAASPPPEKPPGSVPAAKAKAAGGQPGPFRISLPSGKLLTQSLPTFELPQPWPDRLFHRGTTVFVAKAPGDVVRAVFALNKTKLHGASATFHDNGRLETVAFYADGKLNGPLRAWTDRKERLFYAEYANGKKNGLVCLFSSQLPWLVQEWDKALEHEHLVQYVDQSPKVVSSPDLVGAAAAEFSHAKEQLVELEQKLQDNENEFRRKSDGLDPKRKPKAQATAHFPKGFSTRTGNGMAQGARTLQELKGASSLDAGYGTCFLASR